MYKHNLFSKELGTDALGLFVRICFIEVWTCLFKTAAVVMDTVAFSRRQSEVGWLVMHNERPQKFQSDKWEVAENNTDSHLCKLQASLLCLYTSLQCYKQHVTHHTIQFLPLQVKFQLKLTS
jgi:hypothetical protein